MSTPDADRLLPVAGPGEVRRRTAELLRRHRGRLGVAVGLHGCAALTALTGPLVIGILVDRLQRDALTPDTLWLLVALLAGTVTAGAGFTRAAYRQSLLLGEQVFAELREGFVAEVTRLPLSVVERAGSGDLVSRTTHDVETLGESVRQGVPRMLIAAVTMAVTAVALTISAPLVAPAWLVAVPGLAVVARWYLRRARAGYLAELAAYATLNGGVAETVDGALTVTAQRLQPVRRARVDTDLARIYDRERYTLMLRSVWFPVQEFHYVLPVAAILGWGGYLVSTGRAGVGAVTTAALLALQLRYPLDELLEWLDELQLGAAALARIVGVGLVPPDRCAGDRRPAGTAVEVRGARYAYRPGHDVLHGLDLDLRPGERLAVVGPSGAGKSTLGRLLAGIHPPTAGSVRVGGVPLVDLPVEQLRREVLLVTQEHHVFVGSLADNLRLATPDADDDTVLGALAAVGAGGWAQQLPDGLATTVGSGGHPLTPAQAQQVALARLVLAAPHTLVLDEATALLEPGPARDLEQALEVVLRGRTVVAVAHRLHTARVADRVAVVEGGRITELGSHDELLADGGSYAALWRSWNAGH